MVWRAPRMSTWGCWPGAAAAAELEQGLHVERLDDAVEGHLGGRFHAGVGGADGGVEAVDGGVLKAWWAWADARLGARRRWRFASPCGCAGDSALRPLWLDWGRLAGR